MTFVYSRDFLHPVTVQADYAHRRAQDRELALSGPMIWAEGPIQLAMRRGHREVVELRSIAPTHARVPRHHVAAPRLPEFRRPSRPIRRDPTRAGNNRPPSRLDPAFSATPDQ